MDEELYALVARLYPLPRSITGEGLRQTLRMLAEVAPLQLSEVPSGAPALDWNVPLEWNVREAYLERPDGKRIAEFSKSPLNLVAYSVPVEARMPLGELRKHLHALPDRVPWRTSYYEPGWGFCMTQQELDALPDGDYRVHIDSTLAPGSLTYAEAVLQGSSDEEILISAHTCHPSLADDNCSGMAVAALLARKLTGRKLRRTVRFLFAPGTIGTLAWLERNRERAGGICAGMTLTCLGDGHPFTWKRTFAGDAEVDRAAAHVLRHAGLAHQIIDFFPYGYDERQYNSPGFRLPVGSLMRGRHGQFPEYHTSADDLMFVQPARLGESFRIVSALVEVLEANRRYRNLQPYGEPQLGRRGLYHAVGGVDIPGMQLALLWVLNLSDGAHDLLAIADKAGMPFETIRTAAELLQQHDLLAPA